MNQSKIAIVTGASRGLGAAIVTRLLQGGYQVYGLSRSKGEETSPNFHFIEIDLRAPENTRVIASRLIIEIAAQSPKEVILINNAGSADPYGCFGDLDFPLVTSVLNTNLLSTTVLMDLFIHHLQQMPARKTILNVSSQSAENPSAGGSIYCAAKSGIEMLTKAIALEQAKKKFPIFAVAFRPGLMDTELQASARALSIEKFPAAPRFRENFERGLLMDPKKVAIKIVSHIVEGDPKSGAIYDVKDFDENEKRIRFCM